VRGALVLLAVAACGEAAPATDAAVAALVTPAPRRPMHGAMLPDGPIALSWDAGMAAHTEL